MHAVRVVASENLLGQDKCTWGPSYWCKDSLAAKECHAAAYCEERVWKTGPPRAEVCVAYG